MSNADGQEYGWLIERYQHSELQYWTGHAEQVRLAWSNKHSEAIRFAREIDAVTILGWPLKGDGRVALHSWEAERPAPTAEPPSASSTPAAALQIDQLPEQWKQYAELLQSANGQFDGGSAYGLGKARADLLEALPEVHRVLASQQERINVLARQLLEKLGNNWEQINRAEKAEAERDGLQKDCLTAFRQRDALQKELAVQREGTQAWMRRYEVEVQSRVATIDEKGVLQKELEEVKTQLATASRRVALPELIDVKAFETMRAERRAVAKILRPIVGGMAYCDIPEHVSQVVKERDAALKEVAEEKKLTGILALRSMHHMNQRDAAQDALRALQEQIRKVISDHSMRATTVARAMPSFSRWVCTAKLAALLPTAEGPTS